jgi:hypothetical protein
MTRLTPTPFVHSDDCCGNSGGGTTLFITGHFHFVKLFILSRVTGVFTHSITSLTDTMNTSFIFNNSSINLFTPRKYLCIWNQRATVDHPMPKLDIPQMVYFAFDDDVNLKYSGYYFNLFGSNRNNPNNCPMTFTLFTINKGTDYSFVEYFYQQGHEIASHGVNNIPTSSKTLVLSEAVFVLL